MRGCCADSAETSSSLAREPLEIQLGAGQVGSPPVLVVVSSFSRFITAVMLPSRTTPDLLLGMWSAISGQLDASRSV